MIVPTRNRVESARIQAKEHLVKSTGMVDVIYVVDGDHANEHEYARAVNPWHVNFGPWRGLSATLNHYGMLWATHYRYIGFMGDDHLPRTNGWDWSVHAALSMSHNLIAYGSDGQTDPVDKVFPPLTWWVMDSRIITNLGQMVPWPLSHTCVDDYVYQLGRRTNSLVYLPDVLMEHMHPVWGKAKTDDSYERSSEHHNRLADHEKWKHYQECQLPRDILMVERARLTDREIVC
jgi:hypothetical protein